MNLWPVEHFCPPVFSREALIWKKMGDKSVQLVKGSFLSKYFLQNPYFNTFLFFPIFCVLFEELVLYLKFCGNSFEKLIGKLYLEIFFVLFSPKANIFFPTVGA